MITVEAFTHYFEKENKIEFEERDIRIIEIKESYIDKEGFEILLRTILEAELFDINLLSPNKWHAITFTNHLQEEDVDGSYYQWFEYVDAVAL